jgi:hypothetical protein
VDNVIHGRGRRSSVQGAGRDLSELAELARSGLLAEDEWGRAKEAFLGKPADAQANAIHQLRQLANLRREGVLSESEFNSKKWDILARTR